MGTSFRRTDFWDSLRGQVLRLFNVILRHSLTNHCLHTISSIFYLFLHHTVISSKQNKVSPTPLFNVVVIQRPTCMILDKRLGKTLVHLATVCVFVRMTGKIGIFVMCVKLWPKVVALSSNFIHALLAIFLAISYVSDHVYVVVLQKMDTLVRHRNFWGHSNSYGWTTQEFFVPG